MIYTIHLQIIILMLYIHIASIYNDFDFIEQIFSTVTFEENKVDYKAGTKLQKQNVFDDFIDAAEYLIENNISSPEQVVGLRNKNHYFDGVLDMLRYHIQLNAYDYGTSEDSKEMFEYLKNYSPFHNVKEGTSYPATLITTGDHDDRVVPAHSFKFASELQDKQSGNNPILIRVETKAGHGAGTPVSKRIEQLSDIYGFILFNMGFKILPEEVYSKIKG